MILNFPLRPGLFTDAFSGQYHDGGGNYCYVQRNMGGGGQFIVTSFDMVTLDPSNPDAQIDWSTGMPVAVLQLSAVFWTFNANSKSWSLNGKIITAAQLGLGAYSATALPFAIAVLAWHDGALNDNWAKPALDGNDFASLDAALLWLTQNIDQANQAYYKSMAGNGPLFQIALIAMAVVSAGSALGFLGGAVATEGGTLTAAQMLAEQSAEMIGMGFTPADIATSLAGLSDVGQITSIMTAAGIAPAEAASAAASVMGVPESIASTVQTVQQAASAVQDVAQAVGAQPVTAAQMLAEQSAQMLDMGFTQTDIATSLAGLGNAGQITAIMTSAGVPAAEAAAAAAAALTVPETVTTAAAVAQAASTAQQAATVASAGGAAASLTGGLPSVSSIMAAAGAAAKLIGPATALLTAISHGTQVPGYRATGLPTTQLTVGAGTPSSPLSNLASFGPMLQQLMIPGAIIAVALLLPKKSRKGKS